MGSIPMAAWVSVEPSQTIKSPPKALQRSPTEIELDQLQFGRKYNGPETPGSQTAGTNSPLDIESRPATPPMLNETSVVQSLTNPPMNRWRFLNAAMISLAQGMNDSAAGALLPYIESHYGINYTIVSLIFVSTAVGFILAAPFTSTLQTKLGRARMLVMTQIVSAVAYAMISARAPYPVVVVAFFFYGLACAWSLALNNVFCASLANATTILGVFHGAYGIGGTIGPLIATLMVSSGLVWFNYYTILLGMSVVNGIVTFIVNRNYEKESEVPLIRSTTNASSKSEAIAGVLKAMQNRTTILGALFIFAYQGAEVSISGWILSFLLTTRPHPESQSPSLGYVTSGFWAGITLGRFLLSYPAHRIGEKTAVLMLTIGAAGLQIIVWQVPDIIGASVAISLVGLLLGPIYACAISIFSRLLKRNELTSALAFITAVGSSGGAVAPFLTGLLSQRFGTWVVNPLAISLFGAMMVAWLTLPRAPKRNE